MDSIDMHVRNMTQPADDEDDVLTAAMREACAAPRPTRDDSANRLAAQLTSTEGTYSSSASRLARAATPLPRRRNNR